MNIYLIHEDGEARCWMAETPSEAIERAFLDFVRQNNEEGGWDHESETEREYWNGRRVQTNRDAGGLNHAAYKNGR